MLNILTKTALTAVSAISADISRFSDFHRGMMGGMWGFGAFGMVFMVLFWGAVIFLVVWGITRLKRVQKDSAPESSKSSLEILNKRLASGEISEQEYEKIRKKITSG